jgi:hypothetical protein
MRRTINQLHVLVAVLIIITVGVLSCRDNSESQSLALGNNDYKTVYYDSPASIVIDGDLSDWTDIPAPEVTLEADPSSKFNPKQVEGPDDCFATFRCFADDRFVYFAFKVTDDVVHFGEEIFGLSLWDDAVFVNCDPLERNQPTNLRMAMSADSNLKPWFEHWDRLTGNQHVAYPYLLEALGAKGMLRKTDRGYDAEMAIPYSPVREAGPGAVMQMVINAGVADDDDGEDHDHMVRLSASGMAAAVFTPAAGADAGAGSVNAILGKPSGDSEAEAVYELLLESWWEEWVLMSNKLADMPHAPWRDAMLAKALSRGGNTEPALDMFRTIEKNAPDECVRQWARNSMTDLYKELPSTPESEAFFSDLIENDHWVLYGIAMDHFVLDLMLNDTPEKAWDFYAEHAATRPLNYMRCTNTAWIFTEHGDYKHAIEILETAIASTESEMFKSSISSSIIHYRSMMGR